MRIVPSLFGRTQGEEERGRDEPAVPRHMVPGRTAQARRTGGGASRFPGRTESRMYGLSLYKSSIKFTVRIHSSIMLNATSRSSAFAGSTHSSPGALPGAGFDNGTLVMARNPGFGSGLRPGTGLYCAGKSFLPDGL